MNCQIALARAARHDTPTRRKHEEHECGKTIKVRVNSNQKVTL